MSSAGYRPHVNRSLETTELYKSFLNLTNCADIKCLRGLNSTPIFEANRYLYIDAVPNGFPGPSISFGPILDDNFVRQLPLQVLENTKLNSTTGYIKRIIAGGMKNDGVASTIGENSMDISIQNNVY